MGARSLALADTHVSLPRDSYSVVHNPAGLGQLKTINLLFHQHTLIEDIDNQGAVLTVPIYRVVVSAFFSQLDFGTIKGIAPNGLSQGDFDALDWVGAVGFGGSLFSKLFIGVTGKKFSSKIQNSRADVFGADFGIQYQEDWKGNFTFGLAWQNVGMGGGDPKFDQEDLELPERFKGGIWWSPKALSRLSGGVDYVRPDTAEDYYSSGLEYTFLKFSQTQFISRVGYTSRRNDLGDLGGWTAGLGVDWKVFNLDWAWVPYGEFGLTQSITLGLRFGPFGAKEPLKHSETSQRTPRPLEEVAPSKLSTLYLKDGRKLTGKIIEENEEFIAIEFEDKWEKIPLRDIEIMK